MRPSTCTGEIRPYGGMRDNFYRMDNTPNTAQSISSMMVYHTGMLCCVSGVHMLRSGPLCEPEQVCSPHHEEVCTEVLEPSCHTEYQVGGRQVWRGY